MDTNVVEQPGPGAVPGGGAAPAAEWVMGTPEATIDQVDRVLDGVEAALTRLDEGTYGVCRNCGTAIDDTRLAGDPTARTCADCAATIPLHGAAAGSVYAVDRVAELKAEDGDAATVEGVDRGTEFEPDDRTDDEATQAADHAEEAAGAAPGSWVGQGLTEG